MPNTDNMLAGPRAYGYVSDLPSPDEVPGTLSDLWCWAESQESAPISPAMYAEFVLPYLKRVTDRFGLVYYGCCEPNSDRIELIVEAMPNLRSVSVTPWADFDVMSEMLGDRYVFSRKPDPVPISGPSHTGNAPRPTCDAPMTPPRPTTATSSCCSATSTTSVATGPGWRRGSSSRSRSSGCSGPEADATL